MSFKNSFIPRKEIFTELSPRFNCLQRLLQTTVTVVSGPLLRPPVASQDIWTIICYIGQLNQYSSFLITTAAFFIFIMEIQHHD